MWVNVIAIGVINTLDSFGINVPKDVSVLGFDNILGQKLLAPN